MHLLDLINFVQATVIEDWCRGTNFEYVSATQNCNVANLSAAGLESRFSQFTIEPVQQLFELIVNTFRKNPDD